MYFKRTIFLLTYCLVLLSTTQAQEIPPLDESQVQEQKEPIIIRSEVGINSTFFLKQIISLSDTSIAISPYLLTYKLMFNNFGIRTGIGVSYKKEKRTEDEFEDNDTETNSSYDFRIGLEYQNQFHNRWSANVGLDFIYKNNTSKFVADSGFDVFTQETTVKGTGGGPVLGLYFHFNKNLSIYTEGAFYFVRKKEKEIREFTNFPQFDNSEDLVEIAELETFLPATLYVVFRF